MVGGQAAAAAVAGDASTAKRARAETRAALDEVGLDSFETLTSWYMAGPDELRRFVGDGPLLTDDRPLVEYHRSLPAGDPPVDLHRRARRRRRRPSSDDRRRRRGASRPCSSMPAACSCIRTGSRVAAALAAHGVPPTRRRLTAAEPHAKLEMDRGALMAAHRRPAARLDLLRRRAAPRRHHRRRRHRRARWPRCAPTTTPTTSGSTCPTTSCRRWRRCGRSALRLVVVSNANGTLRALFDRVGLTRVVRRRARFARVGRGEARPAAVPPGARPRAAPTPPTTVHVGDFFHIDVEGARAAGLAEAVLLRSGARSTPMPTARGSRRLAELPALVAARQRRRHVAAL